MEMLDDAIHQLQTLKKFEVDIKKALCYGQNSHSFEQVVGLVIQGQLDVHVLDGAIILAETMHYPQYNVYNVFIAAGDLDVILEAQGYLIREAQKRQAKRLSFAGRKGWKRVLEKEGWSNDLILMSKEVPNGKDVETRNSAEHQSAVGSRGEQSVQNAARNRGNGVQPIHG